MTRRRDGPYYRGDEAYARHETDVTGAPGSPIGKAPSSGGGHRPVIAPWLAGYRAGRLPLDIVAGVTLVAVAIPEQLATARLAGMPVVAGLYAFLAGVLLFALLGSNRVMSVGADSTVAPILAIAVAGAVAAGHGAYGPDMALLALMVGTIVVVVGVARMGWIADFLSVPVTTGFLAGIAVTIIAGQLSYVLGVPSVSGNAVVKLVRVAGELGSTNGYTLAVAAMVFAVILAARRLDRRVPGALVAVIISILACSLFDLAAKGVVTLGRLPSGLPPLRLPALSAVTVWHLLPGALSAALIVITQTSATSRSFADLGGFDADIDRDFIGVGAGSLLAAFTGGFAVDASPPRTAVVQASGGRSQVPGLAAAAIVALVLVAAAGALRDLPDATLGAVLILVAVRFVRVRDLADIWRFDRVEFAVALATAATVAFIGVGPGILVAVSLAILDRTWRSARPRDALLGRVPGTTVWWPLSERPDGEQLPGVVAYRYDAPLYFANATRFRDRVHEVVSAATPPPVLFVLDASGMEDLDYTGGRMLLRVVHELHQAGADFAVARATGEMPRDAANAGMRSHVGDDHVFLTVDEAVRRLGPPAAPAAAPPAPSAPPAAPAASD